MQSNIEQLDPFLGEWTLEATFPATGPTGPTGHVVFEPILGGAFLSERSEIPHPDAPDAYKIVVADPDTESYTQHYFDSRGVVRLYAMTFEDGVWTLLREKPDFTPLDFAQRYTGTFSADGRTIEGRWETGTDGGNWELDFELNYLRVK